MKIDNMIRINIIELVDEIREIQNKCKQVENDTRFTPQHKEELLEEIKLKVTVGAKKKLGEVMERLQKEIDNNKAKIKKLYNSCDDYSKLNYLMNKANLELEYIKDVQELESKLESISDLEYRKQVLDLSRMKFDECKDIIKGFELNTMPQEERELREQIAINNFISQDLNNIAYFIEQDMESIIRSNRSMMKYDELLADRTERQINLAVAEQL